MVRNLNDSNMTIVIDSEMTVVNESSNMTVVKVCVNILKRLGPSLNYIFIVS